MFPLRSVWQVGSTQLGYPEERPIVLCEFISGRSYRQQPTAQLAEAFGREIARIHCESEGLDLNRPVHEPQTYMDSSVDALKRVFPNQHQLLDLLESAIPILDGRITCIPKNAPVYGLIHGDVIRANAIVSTDGTLWVIDFDLCGMGWRSYDIASFTYVSSGAQESCANSFRMGYDEVRPLLEVEADILQVFEAARAIFSLGIPAMYFDTWGRSQINATSMDDTRKFVQSTLEKLAESL